MTSLHLYQHTDSFDDGPGKLVLADSIANGKALRAYTAQFSGATPNTFHSQNLLSPASLTADDYFIGYWATERALRYDDLDTVYQADASETYSDTTPADPVNYTNQLANRTYSIYATYTVDAPPASAPPDDGVVWFE